MHYLKSYKGYQIATYEDTYWVRIFHQNVTNGALFSKDRSLLQKQVSFINETDLFSVLGSLNENFYINNTFNFLYYQPDDFPHDYFFFSQKNNSLTSKIAIEPIFKPNLTICNLDNTENGEFTGLTIANDTGALIDGNNFSSWWHYPIGVFSY